MQMNLTCSGVRLYGTTLDITRAVGKRAVGSAVSGRAETRNGPAGGRELKVTDTLSQKVIG